MPNERRPKEDRKCPNCGTEFSRFASQLTPNSCCSKKCGLEWKVKRGAVKKRRGVTNNCLKCGKEVYVSQSVAATGQGKFCSNKCKDSYRHMGYIETQCSYCEKPITKRVSHAKSEELFCDRTCWNLSKIVRPLDWMYNGKPAKMDINGYILLWEPSHPNKAMKGWQYQHRLVAEKKVGRYLKTEEAVHHVNEIKNDNRPENLEVMDALEHAALSSRDWHSKVKGKDAEIAELKARIAELEKLTVS